MDFGSVFGGRNGETSRKNGVEKRLFFRLRFFRVFLRFFAMLARIWEPSESPKFEKIRKKLNKISFLTRSFLKEGSGKVLGRFWEGSGTVLERFLEDV